MEKLVASTGYQGLIRALEITHGVNGWHPHTHEIWFCSSAVEAEELRASVTRQWASACMRAGLLTAEQLTAFEAHAVDVKGWCSTSDYLAKADDARHWGADREMAKASTKAGKLKGMHPFGLLAAAAGDRRSAKLFLEFVDTMKTTRSRQLFWSPGLKGRAGLQEKSDEVLAEEQREDADVLGQLERGDWERVRRNRKRAELLDAAEVGAGQPCLFWWSRCAAEREAHEGRAPSGQLLHRPAQAERFQISGAELRRHLNFHAFFDQPLGAWHLHTFFDLNHLRRRWHSRGCFLRLPLVPAAGGFHLVENTGRHGGGAQTFGRQLRPVLSHALSSGAARCGGLFVEHIDRRVHAHQVEFIS